MQPVPLSTRQIVEVLGGRKVLGLESPSPDQLREKLRKGLPFGALAFLVRTFHLSMKEVEAALLLPARTLARRKKAHRLATDESDRVFRFASVGAYAVAVLGSRDRAVDWLRRPNRALGGVAPLAVMDTELGTQQVEAELGRIEFGVYS